MFILVDDVGWSDTTLYGTTAFYETPHIEQLASRGMTFTHAYSASPLCSATRASILTGLSPARTGITSAACHQPRVALQATPGTRADPGCKAIAPGSATRLRTDYYTLDDALRDAGYATGHFGKWHLGHPPYSPLEHGFDVDVPHWAGAGPAGSYIAPWEFPDFDPDTPNEHIEDRMAKEAVAFMEANRDRPFFLNYWTFSVHVPLEAKPELIDKYRSRANPADAQRSPTYAAMIESMDDAVGTLLGALDRLGIAENTIVVFASDNGGNMYCEVDGTTATSNRPLRGGKATIYDGGIRCPCIVVWPGVVAAGSRSDAVTQSCDFYPTLLEMLRIEPRAGQRFDGISIVPALQGEPLEREAIFTYYPHSPPVPDWLPPSVSVHRGDWKLIRIFFGGDDGEHRWKLFNLRDDIGESNDLAGEEPELVRELDALIEQFLDDTGAVLPIPNPEFDPAVYRLEDEGVALPRVGTSPTVTVAGWRGNDHCSLALRDGSLVIASTGRSPNLTFLFPEGLPAEDLRLRITMSCATRGTFHVFWREEGVTPPFSSERSESFKPRCDGSAHEYRVAFRAQHAVSAVRLYPARGDGETRVTSMELTDASGETLYRWTF